jgi:tricorn protease
VLALTLGGCISAAYADSAYYRFPAVRGDTVVFTAEGDLWKVASKGGTAQRLTTHASAETNAAISPDGQWIAFSASYEGAQEAYVMPIAGGIPKRISFENATVTVLGWSAQGEVLVSHQNDTGPALNTIIASINPTNLQRIIFPISDANEASLDESGKTLYFTRFGVHHRNDSIKKYRGGALAQVWSFDLTSKKEAVKLFSGETSNFKNPMIFKSRLYFLSDKDGFFNLYSSNTDGSNIQQLSKHKDWEVRNAKLGDGKIAYQLGADLHVYDINAKNDENLAINLVSDFEQQRPRHVKNPLEFLTSVQVANKEERLIFTARGQLSVAGLGNQRRVDIQIPAGSRARNAVFSADDKWIYAFVDATGENEIWRFPSNGLGKGEQLTKDADFHRTGLFPSPDGKFLAHTDKRGRLWLLELANKSNQIIDDAFNNGGDAHNDVQWSPDSKTIAVVRGTNSQKRNQIGVYSLESKQLQFVTSDNYESYSPAFSPDGRWMYFLSNRNFQATNGAPWGDRNMGPYFEKRTGIYALALQEGLRFPFKADDELSKAAPKAEVSAEAKAGDSKATDANKTETTKTETAKTEAPKKSNAVQFAGLANRLYQVPIAAGNYRQLSVDDKRLYFVESEAGERTSLKTLAINKNSPSTDVFAAGVRDYDLSLDKKRIYLRTSDFYIVEAGAKAPNDLSKAKVQVNDWSIASSPKLEWKQMYGDAWRMHRDYLFDSNMRGVDWKKMYTKYLPLVDRVTDRAELNDVLSLLISEVSTLHSQIRPGEIRRASADAQASSLGAVFSRTKQGYRIDQIYRSSAELPNERAPLDSPDLDIKEGDIVKAINGKDVTQARDISDLLLNQADKQVLLQIQRGNNPARNVIVTPVAMGKHANLRYTDWELSRAEQVEKASQGKIGYLHLRAMGASDIASFARDFYSNITREGLIIDVRRNNGGNIDSWIIEKLLRQAWVFWNSPYRQPYVNMQQTFRGHLVVLIDEMTYSDGETFAAGVQALKLGPLVGKRTAGAGIWLSDQNTLIDNGVMRAGENGQFSTKDGRWLVEGVGVAPDVEVENPPHASFKGEDKQLETAISLLQKKLKEQPIRPLTPQAIPPLK